MASGKIPNARDVNKENRRTYYEGKKRLKSGDLRSPDNFSEKGEMLH